MTASASAAALTQVAINESNNAVETKDMLGDNRAEIDEENIDGPLSFLVLGVDKSDGGVSRADTIMIAHISEGLDDVSLISIPRDLYVEIADCGYGTPCSNKINASASAFQDQDESRTNVINTVSNLTGITFNGAVEANFDGFLDLIDIVGEIELCPWHDIRSIHGDKKFYPEGCAYYGKDDALDLVRQRYGWDSEEDYANGTWGDFGRQKMQQQAIMSLLTEAKKQGFHKNPTKAVELLRGIGDKLTIDLGELELVDFFAAMIDLDPQDMQRVRVPSQEQSINGISYVVMDEDSGQLEEANKLWEAIKTDTVSEWMVEHPEWVND
ncbi:LCP family protein [Haloglycomyces albus]|uniref:LCP family protein n=1 Tax=Haloglycomyces albus TaxID=526067 RepID=UPI00046D3D2D|nr:LCP family protein [Haloglycomyces albus]